MSNFDIAEILELPELINTTRQKIKNTMDDISKLEMKKDPIEKGVLSEVSKMKDKDDKPLYKTIDLRQIETDTILRKSTKFKEYRDDKAKLLELHNLLDAQKLRIEYLHNRKSAIKMAFKYMELGLDREDVLRRIETLMRANMDYIQEKEASEDVE